MLHRWHQHNDLRLEGYIYISYLISLTICDMPFPFLSPLPPSLQTVLIKIVTTGRQPVSPTLFFFAKDVAGITAGASVNVLIGFSSVGDMYAASFPTYNFIAEIISSGYWTNYLLLSNCTSYVHLKGTSIIALQYTTFASGYATGCAASYCLGFYDLTLMTKDPSYPLNF